jgi:hypothetical protein
VRESVPVAAEDALIASLSLEEAGDRLFA